MAEARWSVRRFAAVDMYGTAGTRRRRRIVAAEFVLGTAGLLALAAILCVHGGWLWGIWALGCGANYGALAVYAVALLRPERLRAELEGADVRSELRRYGVAQLLLFVPGLIALVALLESLHRHRAPRAP